MPNDVTALRYAIFTLGVSAPTRFRCTDCIQIVENGLADLESKKVYADTVLTVSRPIMPW